MILKNIIGVILVGFFYALAVHFSTGLQAARNSELVLDANSRIVSENKTNEVSYLKLQKTERCATNYSENDAELLDVKSFSVLDNGEVSWTSASASRKVSYLVEQCILGKWVVVKTLPMINSSSVKTITHVLLNSGENKLRLVKKEKKKKNVCSETIKVFCKKTPVTFLQKQNALIFSEKSYIKVLYQTGDVYYEGYATSLNISNYYSGSYTIIYDNRSEVFSIKKNVPFMKNV
ncbi:MAG: hypothetical protein NTX97_05050 [Bacteroidetes bacterium]|nr:hypothetical protein [Bacteroidota bacterium]